MKFKKDWALSFQTQKESMENKNNKKTVDTLIGKQPTHNRGG